MSENKEEKAKVDDGLAAKVRKIEATLNKLGKRLEELFGVDLDGDGKIGKFGSGIASVLLIGLCGLLCGSVLAANETVWNIRNTADTADVVKIDAEGDVTATSFTGNGSGITNVSGLTATSITTATLVSNATLKVYGKDGMFTNDVTIRVGGLNNGSIVSNDLQAADIGDVTVGAGGSVDIDADAVGAAELADDAVVKASLSAVDYGIFTAGSDGTTTLDAGTVASNNLVASNMGDITVGAGGSIDINADAVGAAELADDAVVKASLSAVDYGVVTAGSDGTLSLDAGTVASNNLVASDMGDVTVDAGGSVTIDASVVTAAKLADAVQDMVVNSFSAVATPNANGGTNVVVVTAKDMGGNTLAARTAFRCWIADVEYGDAAAVAGDFAVSGGTEIQQVVDKAHYLVGTAAGGTVTLTITDTPGGTNYLHCISGGGNVSSTQMKFDIP